MQILNNGGYPSVIPITGSQNSFGGTAEIHFPINELFSWAGRVEYFLGSSAQTVSATTTQTLKFHTLPVMLGFIYSPLLNSNLRISAGVYVGVALMTSMTVNQISSIINSTVTYTSSDLTELVNLQGSYGLSSSIGALLDIGYRLQSSSYPDGSATITGATAFKANYGGIVARLGLEFKL